MLPAVAPRPGLHVLRGLDDAIALREDLERASHVVVVGAGFIGLEVAASCRARGLQVTAIEALPQLLSPALGDIVCRAVEGLHTDHGVQLRTNVTVAEVLGERRVAGVRLSDDSRVDADVVVVGIGVTPNTEWLSGSGLTLQNGIVCGAAGEAAPGVYAAGDVARIPNRWLDDSPRIEHWTNAVEQAVYVAGQVLGDGGDGFTSVPYFWSDQHDRKIQYAGRSRPGDEVTVVDGSTRDRQFTALYHKGDRLTACVSFSQPRTFVRYRKLLASGANWRDAVESAH
jgi:NADPH-dependent 2,4-dienoyl-CoA reductase/sulfur reductase-like enzyme